MATEYHKSYNSQSGIDITAVFGNAVIGSLQGVSYSITREKAPIYTMGSADPRAFARGKRGIAGSLVFVMFDKHALLSEMKDQEYKFWADKSDIRPGQGALGDLTSTAGGGLGAVIQGNATIAEEQEAGRAAGESDKEVASPWYTDQIPPFDITLTGANEYGAMSVMRIYGIEILNEGYGISIDDIVSEQQFTYVARSISPWESSGVQTGLVPGA